MHRHSDKVVVFVRGVGLHICGRESNSHISAETINFFLVFMSDILQLHPFNL